MKETRGGGEFAELMERAVLKERVGVRGGVRRAEGEEGGGRRDGEDGGTERRELGREGGS